MCKKLLSMLLVLVMVLSLANPVLSAAAETVQPLSTDSGDDLTVGILSDIHVSDHFGEGVQLNRLKKALSFFKTQNVEAVVIAGDLQEYTSAETEADQKKFMGQIAAAWQEIFPAAKGEEGYVELIAIYGNHDTGLSESGWWPEAWGEFSPAYTKTVNGYTFVAAHHFRTPQSAGPVAAQPLLDKAVEENPDKPVFYIQHSWIENTNPGSGYGDGEAQYGYNIVAPYHNVVAFTGHTHVPVTDELSIWQGDEGNGGQFTAINCGTTNYVGDLGDGLHCNEAVQRGNQSQFGMVMKVNGSQIDIARYSFTDMTDDGTSGADKLGENWSWDACDPADRPYAYDKRYEETNAPYFAADAVITADTVTDTTVTVSVPAAAIEQIDGYSDMVARYVVEACNPTTGEVEAWAQIASEYHIDDKPERFSDSYQITVEGLQPGVNYTLKAYALEFYRKRSEPLTLNITTTGSRTFYRHGDVNLDGNVDTADITVLDSIIAAGGDSFPASADVDGNGMLERFDTEILDIMVNQHKVPTDYTTGDFLDTANKVEMSVTTEEINGALVAPVGSYGTDFDSLVVKGDSLRAVRTWVKKAIKEPFTIIWFEQPMDLSAYTHFSFDVFFRNENDRKYLRLSFISTKRQQISRFVALDMSSKGDGWYTATVHLTPMVGVDYSDIVGIRFQHDYKTDTGFDGVTKHPVNLDNFRGSVVQANDADLLTTSTITGGQNIYGAGFTNHTNVATQSTGGDRLMLNGHRRRSLMTLLPLLWICARLFILRLPSSPLMQKAILWEAL